MKCYEKAYESIEIPADIEALRNQEQEAYLNIMKYLHIPQLS